MQNEQEIRADLEQALREVPINYKKIQFLSAKLIEFDKENVRFSIDAGVIDRLGKELVARHETAVSELVKNAYDADAPIVNLIFQNADVEGGTLIVEDFGNGMSREELVRGFMRISSTGKVHSPVSPIYKRSRAGKKGIGRFATQRLGHYLTIFTEKSNEDYRYQVDIDWSEFEMDKELSSITSSIQELPLTGQQGTTLKIVGLRDAWSEAAIKRVYRYVFELLQPFPLSKKRKKEVENLGKQIVDPGFKVNCFSETNGLRVVIANEENMIFEYATAVFEGYVDRGEGFCEVVESRQYEINSDVIPIYQGDKDSNKNYKFLENVHFKAFYFILDKEHIPGNQLSAIKRLSYELGGIRLYRNGFRVLPYGEPGDDWLKLDESIARRTILPVHGNINFFGFVEVTDNQGEKFNETASREGLIETEAVNELQDFVYRALIACVIKVGEARGVKITTGQKGWQKKEKKSTKEKIDEIFDEFDQEIDNDEIGEKKENAEQKKGNREKLKEKIEEIVEEIVEDVKKEKDEEKQQLILETEMLRILASLGLSIGEFTHEMYHYLNAFKSDSSFLARKLVDEQLKTRATRLQENMKAFEMYLSYFNASVSQNTRRELVSQDMREVVNKFCQVISHEMIRSGMSLEPLINGYEILTAPMHPSELASILFNFYSNSLKAIKRKQTNGMIRIETGFTKNGKVYLLFSDNGDGINENDKEKIFNAFFTTSNPAGYEANEAEELTGSGLGLKIVKDMVTSHGGTIKLVTAPEGFSTCFRIEIPAFKNEQN